MDPDPNLIHFRAPFYANVVVDSSNSAVIESPQEMFLKEQKYRYKQCRVLFLSARLSKEENNRFY